MQTIKINIISFPWGTSFAINRKEIAAIDNDFSHPGKHCARFHSFAKTDNCRFADAVEFISDAIEKRFATFGLNVEFINV